MQSAFVTTKMLGFRVLHICFVIGFAVTISCARQDAINNDLVVAEAERKVDIATHIVKTSTALTLENAGRTSVGYFLVPVDPELQNYLSHVAASVSIELFLPFSLETK